VRKRALPQGPPQHRFAPGRCRQSIAHLREQGPLPGDGDVRGGARPGPGPHPPHLEPLAGSGAGSAVSSFLLIARCRHPHPHPDSRFALELDEPVPLLLGLELGGPPRRAALLVWGIRLFSSLLGRRRSGLALAGRRSRPEPAAAAAASPRPGLGRQGDASHGLLPVRAPPRRRQGGAASQLLKERERERDRRRRQQRCRGPTAGRVRRPRSGGRGKERQQEEAGKKARAPPALSPRRGRRRQQVVVVARTKPPPSASPFVHPRSSRPVVLPSSVSFQPLCRVGRETRGGERAFFKTLPAARVEGRRRAGALVGGRHDHRRPTSKIAS
jgi:hypothetical protein